MAGQKDGFVYFRDINTDPVSSVVTTGHKALYTLNDGVFVINASGVIVRLDDYQLIHDVSGALASAIAAISNDNSASPDIIGSGTRAISTQESIIPTIPSSFNLGSLQNPWNDIYLTNTLYFNGIPVSLQPTLNFSGQVNLPINTLSYTVNYGFSAPISAFLIVSIQGVDTDPIPVGMIVDRQTNSFTYKFDSNLQTGNYILHYNLSDKNYTVDNSSFLGTENGDILIDEYGNYLGI